MYYMTAHAGLIVCYQKRLFSESFCVKPSGVLFGDGHMTWSTVWLVFLWSRNCLPFRHFVTAYFWRKLSTLFVKNVDEFWYNLWKYFAGRSAGSAAGRVVKTSSSNRTIGSPSSASSGSNISSAGSSRGGGWVLSYFYVEGGGDSPIYFSLVRC